MRLTWRMYCLVEFRLDPSSCSFVLHSDLNTHRMALGNCTSAAGRCLGHRLRLPYKALTMLKLMLWSQ